MNDWLICEKFALTENQALEIKSIPQDVRFLTQEVANLVRKTGEIADKTAERIESFERTLEKIDSRFNARMDQHEQMHNIYIPTKDDTKTIAAAELAKARRISSSSIPRQIAGRNKIIITVIATAGPIIGLLITLLLSGC